MARAVATRSDPLVGRTLAALDDAGVVWCLPRGGYLDEELDTTGDLDVLVAADAISRADAALRAAGFARQPAWGRGGHRFYLTYDRALDRWLKLDLDSEISFGRYEHLRTDQADACLARRSRRYDCWVLAPDDAFWALLLHCLLDKRTFRPAHRRELAALVNDATADGPLARFVATVLPDDWAAERLIRAVASESWEELLGLTRGLERRWVARSGAAGRRVALTNGALQRGTKLLNVTRRRGISVALLGPDGSGKSTLVAEIGDAFPVPTRAMYMGLYQRGGYDVPMPGVGLVLRLARLWRNAARAAYHQARGRIVLFDRYSFDHRLPASGHQSLKRRARRWLLAHAVPAPDLTLVLDAPGSLLYARKGEHSPEALEEQRQGFLALAARTTGVEVIDVSRELDEVRRDAIDRIWRHYAERWG